MVVVIKDGVVLVVVEIPDGALRSLLAQGGSQPGGGTQSPVQLGRSWVSVRAEVMCEGVRIKGEDEVLRGEVRGEV